MSEQTVEQIVMSSVHLEYTEEWLDVPQTFAGQQCYRVRYVMVYGTDINGVDFLMKKVAQPIPGKLDEREAMLTAEKAALQEKLSLFDAELAEIDKRKGKGK
jgi:hypothetical protein